MATTSPTVRKYCQSAEVKLESERRGCGLGSGVLCFNYAMHLRSSKREALARDFDAKDCKLDYSDACSNVGYSYELDGKAAEAKKYYERSCEVKSGLGCFNLGKQLWQKNRAQSVGYFKQACAYGYQPACGVK